MKKLLIATLGLLSALTPLVAQTTTTTWPASLPMIQSPAALRAYALGQVTRGTISAYSPSILPDNTSQSFIQVVGTDADDVVKKMTAAQFAFKVANLSDQIYTYADLQNTQYESIGGGGTSVSLIKNAGSWTLDPNARFEVDVYDGVYIPTGSATSAEIIFRNADGTIAWTDYIDNVYNGKMYFQFKYAGKLGEIILMDGNGHSVAFKLDGTAIAPSPVTGSITTTLSNFKKVSDGGNINNPVLAEIHPVLPQGTSGAKGAPVILVQLTTSRTVLVGASIVQSNGTPWQNPRSAWYRANGEATPHQIMVFPGQLVPAVLPAGSTIIWFDFDAFDQVATPPYGGGKG